MNLSYFGYVMRSTANGVDNLVDLSDFIKGFVAWKNPAFKKGLMYNGEQLFLLSTGTPSVYYFVQARDREIIKKIEKNTISVSDIHKALQNYESVGFASYIVFQKQWFGIGSRVLSPRVTAFAHFMEQLLSKLNCKYQFIPRVLREKIKRSDIPKLEEVSSISIEMSVANSIAKDLIKTVTAGSGQGTYDIASVAIVFKRLRKGKKSLLPVLRSALKTIPSSSLESLDVRARRQAGELMTDLYIVGEGGLRDEINTEDEDAIASEIVMKASANTTRKEKVKELQNGSIKTVTSASTLGLDWKSAIRNSGFNP